MLILFKIIYFAFIEKNMHRKHNHTSFVTSSYWALCASPPLRLSSLSHVIPLLVPWLILNLEFISPLFFFF